MKPALIAPVFPEIQIAIWIFISITLSLVSRKQVVCIISRFQPAILSWIDLIITD